MLGIYSRVIGIALSFQPYGWSLSVHLVAIIIWQITYSEWQNTYGDGSIELVICDVFKKRLIGHVLVTVCVTASIPYYYYIFSTFSDKKNNIVDL